MKRKTTLLLTGFILSQILWSCSSVKLAHIEKRRYMDGYYVDLGNRNINKKQSRVFGIKKVNDEKKHTEELQKHKYLTNFENAIQNDIIEGKKDDKTKFKRFGRIYPAFAGRSCYDRRRPEERRAQHDKAISRIHKKIKSSVTNALAYNSSTKSANKVIDSSKGLNLMIIGGIMILAAIVLLPFYFGFLSYLLMLSGFALGVIGLLIYLEVIDI